MTNAPTTRETADHAELARLAEAATPGPWKACGTIYEHMNCEVRGGAKGEGQAIAQVWDGPNAFRDGQFIAAANPATVLSLLSEIATLRGERDRLARINADHCSSVNTYVISNARLDDRATQAERQRDEALGLLRRWTQLDGQWSANIDTGAFLGRIANQGADQ